MLRLRDGSRRLSGSEFQVDEPATAKHRSHVNPVNPLHDDGLDDNAAALSLLT